MSDIGGTTAKALSDVYRLKAGLSPLHNLDRLTAGVERFQRWVSPFLGSGEGHSLAVVTGPYGAGKTHALQVCRLLAARKGLATTSVSPDLGQSILGHPQRLISSLILNMASGSGSQVTSSMDLFWELWGRPGKPGSLLDCLKEVRGQGDPVTWVTREIIDRARVALAANDVEPLIDDLFGLSLLSKPSNGTTRDNAYGLLGLWSGLFRLARGTAGTLFLLDEVETLFRPNVCPSIASRRAAYRGLSGFLGGRLLDIRGLFAVTPDGLEQLKQELEWQLGVADGMQGITLTEDTRRFLEAFKKAVVHVIPVPARSELLDMADNIRGLHLDARGETLDTRAVSALAGDLADSGVESPRALSRAVIARLEGEWQLRWENEDDEIGQ